MIVAYWFGQLALQIKSEKSLTGVKRNAKRK